MNCVHCLTTSIVSPDGVHQDVREHESNIKVTRTIERVEAALQQAPISRTSTRIQPTMEMAGGADIFIADPSTSPSRLSPIGERGSDEATP